MVSVATGRRSVELNDFLGMEIPLPSIEEQHTIVTQIEKQKGIIEGAMQIISNADIDFEISYDWGKEKLKDVCDKIFTVIHLPIW